MEDAKVQALALDEIDMVGGGCGPCEDLLEAAKELVEAAKEALKEFTDNIPTVPPVL